MANEDENGQEKTEEATDRRKKKAAEDGQIERSRELANFFVVTSGVVSLYAFSNFALSVIFDYVHTIFEFERDLIFDDNAGYKMLMFALEDFALIMVPLCLIILTATFVSTLMLGGWNFTTKAIQPKLSKLNPLKGLKRIFGIQGLVELAKSLAKFFVIGCMLFFIFHWRFDEMIALSTMPIGEAITEAVWILISSAILLALSLIVIAAIDVPYQIYNHAKQIRMTMQEVKDEFKDVEGKPEIKRKIRELQMRVAMGRMMDEVPTADVVVTNPTHFSVALRYDTDRAAAPFVVAKGTDEIALKIREVADAHDVPVVSTPPLARALYHSTEINQEVPEGLYVSVAQVLAYVFQLKRYQQGEGQKPAPLANDLPIPDELQVP